MADNNKSDLERKLKIKKRFLDRLCRSIDSLPISIMVDVQESIDAHNKEEAHKMLDEGYNEIREFRRKYFNQIIIDYRTEIDSITKELENK